MPSRYEPAARQAAARWGIPWEIFSRLIQHESAWDPNAVSKDGAVGLTQLMPDTASGLGVNPHDPVANLNGGARYLAEQYKAFGSWRLALAAYEWGPNAVRRAGNRVPAAAESYVDYVLAGGPGTQHNYIPQGNYVNPVPSGSAVETYDQGIDWRGKPGQEVVAMGDSQVIRISTDAGGFGTAIYLRLLDGPWKGRVWYIGHTVPTVKAGQKVQVGSPVAMLLQHPLGNASGIPGHTEIGWAKNDGSGPLYSGMGHGMNMPGGSAFAKDLASMGILAAGAHATSVFTSVDSSGNFTGQPSAAQLTPQQRNLMNAQNAAMSVNPNLDVQIPEVDTSVFDASQLWQQIAAQDSISPETQQIAAQYVNRQTQGMGFDLNPFRPQPFQPTPGPTG